MIVSVDDHLFYMVVRTIAAVTHPKLSFCARDWYSARRLARLRRFVGTPVPTDSLVIRKAQS